MGSMERSGRAEKSIRLRKKEKEKETEIQMPRKYILAAAIITITMLMLLLRLGNMTASSGERHMEVPERNGSYQLTGITSWDKLLVNLPPGRQYYPGVLLTPDTIDFALPEESQQLP